MSKRQSVNLLEWANSANVAEQAVREARKWKSITETHPSNMEAQKFARGVFLTFIEPLVSIYLKNNYQFDYQIESFAHKNPVLAEALTYLDKAARVGWKHAVPSKFVEGTAEPKAEWPPISVAPPDWGWIEVLELATAELIRVLEGEPEFDPDLWLTNKECLELAEGRGKYISKTNFSTLINRDGSPLISAQGEKNRRYVEPVSFFAWLKTCDLKENPNPKKKIASH